MTRGMRQLIFVSQDHGLLAHWQRAFGKSHTGTATSLQDISKYLKEGNTTIWVDEALASPPDWHGQEWQRLLHIPNVRVVATSSYPIDDKAIEALDAGCAGYCQAFADAATLKQVQQVIEAGHVWIGKNLMQRLLQATNKIAGAKSRKSSDWSAPLTQREREVAIQAANGASNLAISINCSISERTVKAHISSIFSKLEITDRLQLALKVHGIN